MNLPIAPRPYSDELISSWIGRTAARYNMSALDLRTSLAAAQSKITDAPPKMSEGGVDYAMCPKEIDLLAKAFQISPNILTMMDLSNAFPIFPERWVSQIEIEDIVNRTFVRTGVTSWVYCRNCLNEDAVKGQDTYIRRHWALGCYGYCHRHHSPLIQHCLNCTANNSLCFAFQGSVCYLICNQCGNPIHLSNGPKSVSRQLQDGFRVGDKYAKRAHSIVMRFENDLFKALIGSRPSSHWMGQTDHRSFVTAIEDHLFLISVNYLSNQPRDRLINQVECRVFPNHDKLTSFVDILLPAPHVHPQKRRLLFATLAACFGPAKDVSYFYDSTYNSFATRSDSLEYVWNYFKESPKVDLNKMSERWPLEIQDRFRHYLKSME